MNKGLFDILPSILSSRHEKIFEQGAWAVGNICSEDFSFKERLQTPEILNPIVQKLLSTQDENVSKNTTWTLCNLVSGSGLKSKLELRRTAYNTLIVLSKKHQDLEILESVLKCILDLTSNDLLEIIISSGLLNRLIELISKDSKPLMHVCLQIICFVTNGNNQQTQAVLDAGGIVQVFRLLNSNDVDKYCKKESLWIISNVAVGPREQMEYIFNKEDWVSLLFRISIEENNLLKKEAIWTLCNSTKYGDANHISKLIRLGLFRLYSLNLEMETEQDLIKTIIESMNHILRQGIPQEAGSFNYFQPQIEAEGIIDKLEKLQMHSNRKVYETISALIENYFKVQDPL